jgi:hypothetical protein
MHGYGLAVRQLNISKEALVATEEARWNERTGELHGRGRCRFS